MSGWIDRLKAFALSHRAELGLSVRVTAAAIAALVIALALELKLPLWAVLTAIIVTQLSVGRSLQATRDYLIGTLCGALYGGAIAILIPHSGEGALLLVLVLAVAPLAFIAAVNPGFNAATVTAIIVLLLPLMNRGTPLESAIDRVFEVAIGATTGLAVSFLVFPSRAHNQMRRGAARVLDLMAGVLSELLKGAVRGQDKEALHRLQDGIGAAIGGLAVTGTEADRERGAGLSAGPETGPLLRTVLRLRHDLVMLGRASVTPLPEALQGRLSEALLQVSNAIGGYLRAAALALRQKQSAPDFGDVETALKAYAAATAAIRGERLTRGLPAETAEQFFALGFSLEQIRQNLKDLQRCIDEWSGRPAPAAHLQAAAEPDEMT